MNKTIILYGLLCTLSSGTLLQAPPERENREERQEQREEEKQKKEREEQERKELKEKMIREQKEIAKKNDTAHDPKNKDRNKKVQEELGLKDQGVEVKIGGIKDAVDHEKKTKEFEKKLGLSKETASQISELFNEARYSKKEQEKLQDGMHFLITREINTLLERGDAKEARKIKSNFLDADGTLKEEFKERLQKAESNGKLGWLSLFKNAEGKVSFSALKDLVTTLGKKLVTTKTGKVLLTIGAGAAFGPIGAGIAASGFIIHHGFKKIISKKSAPKETAQKETKKTTKSA